MFNLQVVQTGEKRFTCQPGSSVHDPVKLGVDEKTQVRTVFIPNAPLEKSVAFGRSDVGRWMGYSQPAHVSLRCNLTEEDEGVIKVITPGGVQDLHVLYWSGLTKVIMHSQAQEAHKAQMNLGLFE